MCALQKFGALGPYGCIAYVEAWNIMWILLAGIIFRIWKIENLVYGLEIPYPVRIN